jgi:GNAT superfamily N-acetyltransferase
VSYTIRAAYRGDTYQVYALLNREDVCMWNTKGSPVTWEMHEAWFDRYFTDNGLLFLLDCDGAVGGEVHYDRGEENGVVGASAHIALQPEARGRGIGRWLLKSTMPHAYDKYGALFLLAIIRPLNKKSIDCFTSCGFKYHSTKGMARYVHGGG